MRKFAIGFLGVSLAILAMAIMAAIVDGGEICTKRGEATYCDKSGPTYETKQGYIYGLQKNGKPGASVSRFGNSMLDNRDGSVRTRNRNGDVNSNLKHRYGTRDRVIDDRFGKDRR